MSERVVDGRLRQKPVVRRCREARCSQKGRTNDSESRRVWRSINRLRSLIFTYAINLQLEPMELNFESGLTFLLLQLETSNLRLS